MATFTAFKSDVLRLCIENTGNDGSHGISLQVYNFSRSSKCFKRSLDKVLPLSSSTFSPFEIVSVKCLLNASSGLHLPCLLLRHAPTNLASGEEFDVLLLENYDSVLLRGSFEVTRMETLNIEFHLLDGPSVCWTLGGTAYCARYDSILEKFTVDSLAVDNSMNEQPGVEFNLFWCGLIRGQVVAMGAKSDLTDTSLSPRWTCVNHSQSSIQDIPLVPNVYAPIATCCFVREAIHEVSLGSSESFYDGLEIFLATNWGQLLKFANGCLKNCWQLPFKDPERIWVIEPEPDEVIIMLASKTKNVCSVNFKKKKVVKEWHEIEVILVDDFLEKGSEQVLFLPKSFNISKNRELSDFTLIDVGKGMSSIKDTQDCSQSQPLTDSLQKTAQALKTRLQARASTLFEAKLEYQEKLKMTENCCKVLKNITSSCSPPGEEKQEKFPGLFCLLEGDLNEAELPLTGEQCTSPYNLLGSSLTIKEIWQRIVCNQWIVGVDVENNSGRAASDLVLGLVSCQLEGVAYTSKRVFCGDDVNQQKHTDIHRRLATNNDAKSPSMKRKRMVNSNSAVDQKLLPGNLTRLTAVTSLPRLIYKNSCSLSVVVTWTSHCVDGSFDQHSMHCGHVTIDAEQIINGSLNLMSSMDHKSVQQDIAALKLVSIETELVLQSRFLRPHQLILLLKNSLRDVPVLQTETSEHQTVFRHLLPVLHDDGPLGGAAVVLKDDLKNGQMSLITRNKKQVFLLQHRLRQVLPNDIQILVNPAYDLSSIKDGLHALNNEATYLQRNLHKLMEKNRRPADFDTSENCNHDSGNDSIKALREGFERKRERELKKMEEISGEQSDLASLWSEFVLDQTSTDIAIANMQYHL